MLYIDPEGVKAKKKQRKIDFEISTLRLKLVNTSGKSIVLSNREIRLLRYYTTSSGALFKNHLNFNLIQSQKRLCNVHGLENTEYKGSRSQVSILFSTPAAQKN